MRTGNWEVKVAQMNISGTTQSVLVSDVAVGTSASTSPSLLDMMLLNLQYGISQIPFGRNLGKQWWERNDSAKKTGKKAFASTF
ncbi:hypothetical protein EV368DRAFT_89522 [Lentinula lateritia]|nr:hypothetical protein EV368DRAFT_89522 [Lentinula lateritia]